MEGTRKGNRKENLNVERNLRVDGGKKEKGILRQCG